jgi:hypothetical protein
MVNASHQVGILAFSSLLVDPGAEIQAAIAESVSVRTPFNVEYARASAARQNAPTLVVVPSEVGSPVQGKIYLLMPEITVKQAQDMLYRRERNQVGVLEVWYDEERLRLQRGAVLIGESREFAGMPLILFPRVPPNIDIVQDEHAWPGEKAETLADLAIRSLTKVTYAQRRDGIAYLADAIGCGIRTVLTDVYVQAVLRHAGNAPDLEAARTYLAHIKKLA